MALAMARLRTAGESRPPPQRHFATSRRPTGREQPVAAIGQVDPAALLEQSGPLVEDHGQPLERFLPVDREIGQIRREIAQPRRIHLLDQQLVEGPGEVRGKAQRLGCVDPVHLTLDQAGEQEQPLDRFDRRRNRIRAVQRFERAADPLVQLGIADRHQPGEQQSALGPSHEGIGDGAGGAVVGDERVPRASPMLSRPWRAMSPAARASAKARCGGMVKTVGRAGLTRSD